MEEFLNDEVKTARPTTDNQPMASDATTSVNAAENNPEGRSKPKNTWDKADVLGKLLGSILIPVALAVTGFYINFAIEKRTERQKQDEILSSATLKTQEIAITVLQAKDTPESVVREWALNVFNDMTKTAGHPLSNKVLNDLQNHTLPSSNAGAASIAADSEDLTLSPRQDKRGIWYIGFGHIQGVGPDTPPITVGKAFTILMDDMKAAGDVVDRMVKVPITSSQRDALVDLVFNIGASPFASSSVLRETNAGNCDKAREAFMLWTRNTVNGQWQQVTELVKRRERELQAWNCPKPSR